MIIIHRLELLNRNSQKI